MAELHPDLARDQARKAYTFTQSFNNFGGKPIDWQNGEPWPHRSDLAHALEWIEELSAMVLNLADRVAEESLQDRVAALEKRADMPVRDGHPLWKPTMTATHQGGASPTHLKG
jgi:hypothetical protein